MIKDRSTCALRRMYQRARTAPGFSFFTLSSAPRGACLMSDLTSHEAQESLRSAGERLSNVRTTTTWKTGGTEALPSRIAPKQKVFCSALISQLLRRTAYVSYPSRYAPLRGAICQRALLKSYYKMYTKYVLEGLSCKRHSSPLILIDNLDGTY